MLGAISSPVVVIDASLVVDLLLTGTPDQPVSTRWQLWEETGTQLVAPGLIGFEITNALYQQQRRNLISTEIVDRAMSDFLELQIGLVEARSISPRALALARFYGASRTYDFAYVALAELLGCQLWTTDFSLYRTVQHHHGYVQVIPVSL